MLPKSISIELGSCSRIVGSPAFTAAFMMESGVAPVSASRYVPNPCPGTGHVVICTGNEIRRKARPASAGLKRLQPSPPNVIFTTPIAKSEPMTIIHIGRFDGTLNANKIPVNTAEPSVMVSLSFLRMNLLIAHSKNTHDATAVRVAIIAPTPKNTNEQTSAGTRAMQTPYMFFCTLSPLCMCGDNDTINFFAIIYCQLFIFLRCVL